MQCLSPITLRVNDEIRIVPCGRCPACKENKALDWVVRLSEEQKHSLNTYFVTLTYRDEDLVFSSCSSLDLKCRFPILCKRDVQLFIKRLRKQTKMKFKYFFCGEYGPQTYRPHYHGLIFCQGVMNSEEVLSAWSHQDLILNCFALARPGAAQAYCTKYLQKTLFLPCWIRDVKEYMPFNMMSKGLGITLFEDPQVYEHKVMNSDATIFYDGRKVKMPRYYRDKLFTNDIQKRMMSLNNEDYQRLKRNKLCDTLKKKGITFKDYQKQCYSEAYRKAWKKIKEKIQL